MTCPNCKAEVGQGEAYCRECGQPIIRPPVILPPDEKKGLSPGARSVLLAICVVLLVLVGLPACLVGGCFLAFAGSAPAGMSAGHATENMEMWLGGMFGILVFGFLLWAVFALSRRK